MEVHLILTLFLPPPITSFDSQTHARTHTHTHTHTHTYTRMYIHKKGLSLYLEDLYVQEASRGKGVGLALLRAVAAVAKENDCARWQWQCIDWNSSALGFYRERMGARERVETGDAKWINLIMGRPEIDAFLKT